MHYRRQLALDEARAWSQANQQDGLRAADGSRLPAELQGIRIRGIVKEPAADGRVENLPWRHVASTPERSQRTRRLKNGGTVRTVSGHGRTSSSDKAGPSDGTQAIGYREHEGPTPEQIKRDTQIYALSGRSQALRELREHGQLTPKTAILGEKVKREHRLSTPISRQTRVVRLSALDRVSVDPESGRTTATSHGEILVDRSRLQKLAAQELEEVLVLHLTEKEVRALRLRAEGIPQEDAAGYTLKRAQRKAQAALQGA